jgi:CRP-like cAMP-binding protein
MLNHPMIRLVELADGMDYSRLQILANVNLAAIEGLLEACPVRELHPGETLLEPGRINHTLYAVLSGELSVHLDSPDGEPVRTIGAGETVMELSVIDGRPTAAWIVADMPVRVLAMDRDVFWAMVSSSHPFACNLLRLLAARLRSGNRLLERDLPPVALAS